jgi:hypothetical protein
MSKAEPGAASPVGPLKYPRYRVCVWYVSHVEKNMGSTGISAVKAPILVEPYPTAAVSKRLASVQLRESMPWLFYISLGIGALGYVTYSKSSPSGLDVPVRRACLPSTLSIVEYIHI